MRLRKLLIATGAIVAAGVMAITPSAMAANTVTVGSNTTGNHAINLSFKSASVTVAIYGFPTSITCTAGSESGVAHAGTGLANWATITSLSFTCPSIMPGTTVSMSATCNIGIEATSGYTAGTDTAVVGREKLTNGTGTDCVGVSISNGCTFTVGNYSTARFNESTQALTLSGNTATIHNPTGCLGMISNNQTFTLNAAFDVQSPDGLINIL